MEGLRDDGMVAYPKPGTSMRSGVELKHKHAAALAVTPAKILPSALESYSSYGRAEFEHNQHPWNNRGSSKIYVGDGLQPSNSSPNSSLPSASASYSRYGILQFEDNQYPWNNKGNRETYMENIQPSLLSSSIQKRDYRQTTYIQDEDIKKVALNSSTISDPYDAKDRLGPISSSGKLDRGYTGYSSYLGHMDTGNASFLSGGVLVTDYNHKSAKVTDQNRIHPFSTNPINVDDRQSLKQTRLEEEYSQFLSSVTSRQEEASCFSIHQENKRKRSDSHNTDQNPPRKKVSRLDHSNEYEHKISPEKDNLSQTRRGIDCKQPQRESRFESGNNLDQLITANVFSQSNRGIQYDSDQSRRKTRVSRFDQSDEYGGRTSHEKDEHSQARRGIVSKQPQRESRFENLNMGNQIVHLNRAGEFVPHQRSKFDQVNIRNENIHLNKGKELRPVKSGNETNQLESGNNLDQLTTANVFSQSNRGIQYDSDQSRQKTRVSRFDQSDEYGGRTSHEKDKHRQTKRGIDSKQPQRESRFENTNMGNEVIRWNEAGEFEFQKGNELDQANRRKEYKQMNKGKELRPMKSGNETNQLESGDNLDQLNIASDFSQIIRWNEAGEFEFQKGNELDQVNTRNELGQLQREHEFIQSNKRNEFQLLNRENELNQMNRGNELRSMSTMNEVSKLKCGNDFSQFNTASEFNQLNQGNQLDQLNSEIRLNQLNMLDEFSQLRCGNSFNKLSTGILLNQPHVIGGNQFDQANLGIQLNQLNMGNELVLLNNGVGANLLRSGSEMGQLNKSVDPNMLIMGGNFNQMARTEDLKFMPMKEDIVGFPFEQTMAAIKQSNENANMMWTQRELTVPGGFQRPLQGGVEQLSYPMNLQDVSAGIGTGSQNSLNTCDQGSQGGLLPLPSRKHPLSDSYKSQDPSCFSSQKVSRTVVPDKDRNLVARSSSGREREKSSEVERGFEKRNRHGLEKSSQSKTQSKKANVKVVKQTEKEGNKIPSRERRAGRHQTTDRRETWMERGAGRDRSTQRGSYSKDGKALEEKSGTLRQRSVERSRSQDRKRVETSVKKESIKSYADIKKTQILIKRDDSKQTLRKKLNLDKHIEKKSQKPASLKQVKQEDRMRDFARELTGSERQLKSLQNLADVKQLSKLVAHINSNPPLPEDDPIQYIDTTASHLGLNLRYYSTSQKVMVTKKIFLKGKRKVEKKEEEIYEGTLVCDYVSLSNYKSNNSVLTKNNTYNNALKILRTVPVEQIVSQSVIPDYVKANPDFQVFCRLDVKSVKDCNISADTPTDIPTDMLTKSHTKPAVDTEVLEMESAFDEPVSPEKKKMAGAVQVATTVTKDNSVDSEENMSEKSTNVDTEKMPALSDSSKTHKGERHGVEISSSVTTEETDGDPNSSTNKADQLSRLVAYIHTNSSKGQTPFAYLHKASAVLQLNLQYYSTTRRIKETDIKPGCRYSVTNQIQIYDGAVLLKDIVLGKFSSSNPVMTKNNTYSKAIKTLLRVPVEKMMDLSIFSNNMKSGVNFQTLRRLCVQSIGGTPEPSISTDEKAQVCRSATKDPETTQKGIAADSSDTVINITEFETAEAVNKGKTGSSEMDVAVTKQLQQLQKHSSSEKIKVPNTSKTGNPGSLKISGNEEKDVGISTNFESKNATVGLNNSNISAVGKENVVRKLKGLIKNIETIRQAASCASAFSNASKQLKIEICLIFLKQSEDQVDSSVMCEIFLEDTFVSSAEASDKSKSKENAYKQVCDTLTQNSISTLVNTGRRLCLQDRLRPTVSGILFEGFRREHRGNMKILKNIGYYPVDLSKPFEDLVVIETGSKKTALDDYKTLIQMTVANAMLMEYTVEPLQQDGKTKYFCKMVIQQKLITGSIGATEQEARQRGASDAVKSLYQTQDIIKYISLGIPGEQHMLTLDKLKEMAKKKKEESGGGGDDIDEKSEEGLKWLTVIIEEILANYMKEITLQERAFSLKIPDQIINILSRTVRVHGMHMLVRGTNKDRYYSVNKKKRMPDEIVKILQLCGGKSGQYQLIKCKNPLSKEDLERVKGQYLADEAVTD